jgi:MFS family permease
VTTKDLGNDSSVNTFLLLYGLAWAGGSIAYIPFLTILLPVDVMTLAGSSKVDWLAYLAFAGAIAASLSNIAAGWISDRTHNRSGWVSLGMLSCCGLLVAFRWADSFAELLALIVLWQVALNMMLAPLAAWAGDCVPDDRKGLLGGLMSVAPASGAITGAAIMIPGGVPPDARLWVVAALTLSFIAPILVYSYLRPLNTNQNLALQVVSGKTGVPKQAILSMWLARFMLQVTEATLFAFLYYWLQSIDPQVQPDFSANLFSLAVILTVPIAFWVGRRADREGKPLRPLIAASAVTAVALLIMASASTITLAFLGYVVFGIAASLFLALHGAQTLKMLPRSERRGLDLGIFNLTNTIPSLIMPWLTVLLVPAFGFTGLFILLAALSAIAGTLLFFVSR